MRDRRFEELVRAHQRAVRTYAQSLASTPTIADEATQETFLRAWRYLDSFRGEGSFEGWLLRICRNRLRDLEADERRRRPTPTDVALLPIPPDHRHDLLDVVERLSPDHREVIVLCGVLGYDYESAAVVLGVPVGTIRSRLHRARMLLTQELEDIELGSA